MGLEIVVGILAECGEGEDRESILNDFEQVNQALAAVGLMRHIEPEALENQRPAWEWQMTGYSGLHYLRRIAAYLALGRELPPPGDDSASKDPVVQEYYEDRISCGRFCHLMFHSDAEGFYVPSDFMPVVFAPGDIEVPGGSIGSSYRLKDDCEELAAALELPLDLHPEDEQVSDAIQSMSKAAAKWQRFGIESHACLVLYHAACRSIESGAAIVFC